jgi:hypothetical protein
MPQAYSLIPLKTAKNLMLTFKLLIINNVDVLKSLLTSVLTFKLLAINDVDVVDLYMRIYHLHSTRPPSTFNLQPPTFNLSSAE